jgi:hypothetical protein
VFVVSVFAFLVVYLTNTQGCSKLEMGLPKWFQGSFEHCAVAAGEATKQVVLNAGGSEVAASAAGNAAKSAALTAFNSGESANEASKAAGNAAAMAIRSMIKSNATRSISSIEETNRLAEAAAAAAAAGASSGSAQRGIEVGNNVAGLPASSGNAEQPSTSGNNTSGTSPTVIPQQPSSSGNTGQHSLPDERNTSQKDSFQDKREETLPVIPRTDGSVSNDTG